jgi:hypothetical protein
MQQQQQQSDQGSSYWGNVLFSRFANKPAKADPVPSTVGQVATSSFVNAKGTQRKELIGKLKGLLAQRLSEDDKPPAHAELAQKKAPLAGKVISQGSEWRELKAASGRSVHRVCVCVCVFGNYSMWNIQALEN